MDKILLDVHCHLVPLTPALTEGIGGVAWDGGRAPLTIDGYTLASPDVYRVEALLDWMDANAVGRAWISVPPPLYRLGLDEARAVEWTGRLNQGLADVAGRHGDRLTPMFHLPVQHPAAAASLAREWSAREKPIFAMPAGSAADGIVLSGEAYVPLWQALDAVDAFLFLHPCKGCDPRYEPFYLHNLAGSPIETALAAAHLSLSGILDRHTRITFCLAHAGGATAAIAGRLERGQLTGRPGADTGARKPRQALRNVCIDCISHDAAALGFAASMHGEDNVFFGSDWPFAMGLPEPHSQLGEVAPALKRKMFEGNPRRLLSKFGL
ncbi:amidohydrolase family protein [Oceanibacterium hippocampi]|uniref:Amidohydrolase n=1 Tax=Oceanibacterium hippocampi TaxID=745714 RepID=A0A1Y5SR86_9PROT|nr:amidohydrolase family protein [Oceanibacterium hippocampi]SLN46435.1 Amidohydrolase [Oceanibacterium hippocampi]